MKKITYLFYALIFYQKYGFIFTKKNLKVLYIFHSYAENFSACGNFPLTGRHERCETKDVFTVASRLFLN